MGVEGERAHRPGEGVDVAGGRQEAGDPGRDQAAAAGGVGADGGQATGHGLECHGSESLGVARKQEHVGRGVGDGQVLAGEKAGEDRIR